MDTLLLLSASLEAVIRLPEEKGDAVYVEQSLSSAHLSLAGLICTCMSGYVLRIISSFCCT